MRLWKHVALQGTAGEDFTPIMTEQRVALPPPTPLSWSPAESNRLKMRVLPTFFPIIERFICCCVFLVCPTGVREVERNVQRCAHVCAKQEQ